eukprot:gene1373-1392_t
MTRCLTTLTRLAIIAALVTTVTAVPSNATEEKVLSLKAFTQAVLKADETITSRRVDVGIAETDIDVAKGAFEPVGFIGGRRDERNVQNTTQQKLQYGNIPIYDSKTTEYKAGVATHFITGADVELAYKVARYRDNLQPANLRGKEYRSVPSISITQPLIRGAGTDVNRAPVGVAERDRQIAVQLLRQAIAQRLMDAVGAYIAAQEATDHLRLARTSLEIAEKLLKDAKRLVAAGIRGDSAVVEAQAQRDTQKVQVGIARQELNDARNTMRMLTLVDPAGPSVLPEAAFIANVAPLDDVVIKIPASDVIRRSAFDNRPEARAADLRLEREQLRILVAENQMLPQLDVSANYDFDGLAGSPQSSLNLAVRGPHRSWGAGIELKVPLQGNQRARALLDASAMRKSQAIMALTAARKRLANEVEATSKAARIAIDMLDDQKQLLASQEALLRLAQAQVQQGHGSSLELLRRQMEVNREEVRLLSRRSAVARAAYALSFTAGTLSAELGLE